MSKYEQAVSSRVRSGWITMFIAGMMAPCFYAYGAGATTPFKTCEAEDGALAGGAAVLSMTTLPTKPTVQLESSGRKCVELNATGESVTWTTTAECNAIVVRASIPDSSGGGGITKTLNLYINGTKRQAITMNSKYSWIYGVESFTNNNPSAGTPKRFYDTYRAFLPTNYPAGTTIMLKKDSDNSAAYYRIDLIQLEKVGPPLTQPANTLSVTSYGATGSDTTDDSTAFKNCIKACESQGKGMWIPAGKFYTKGVIFADDISIYGAGMWYTENHRIIGDRHKWDLGNCTIQDLYITVPETGKTLATGHDYGLNMSGSGGWLAQRVWVHRAGACFWLSGTDGTIKDCRSTESWADGMNLNNSSTIDSTKRGIRLTATNNYIIGSADDGIALNAQNGGGVTYNMVDTKIQNNTSIAVNWANGIRIAGGRNTLVQNNLITDPTDSNGIRVGQFGADGSPCESLLVSDNVIRRGCGIRTRFGHGGIAVTDGAKATVRANTISDSPGLGIDVQSCQATFENNVVERPALQGFLVKSGSVGSGTFTGNTVSGLASGMVAFRNDASSFTVTSSGNSWQSVVTLPAVGSIITLKAVNGKYVSATYSTNNTLIANKIAISNYERFKVVNATNCVALQCMGNNKFVSIDAANGSKPMVANRASIGSFEKFQLVESGSQIAIRSVLTTNYASAVSNGVAPLQANQTYIGSYEKFTWKVE